MTEQQRRIAAYVAAHPLFGDRTAWMRPPALLPDTEEACEQLLGDAEFRALALGTALGSTEGRVIAEAVSLVVPPDYPALFNLTVDALTLAGERQSAEGRRRAGAIALGVIGGGLLVALMIADGGGS
ncbi:MAG: hypothetical protein ACLQBB_15315 [Solirubrobacteraceae bacterium]